MNKLFFNVFERLNKMNKCTFTFAFANVHSKVESLQQTREMRLFCQSPTMFVRSILIGSNRVHYCDYCATK